MPFSACGGVVALSSFDAPRTAAAPRVAVVMGSDSDLPTMQPAVQVLEQFGVAVEVRVLSAHRTPLEMVEFAQMARGRGFKVIVAGAGGAAHAGHDRVELGLDGRAQGGHGRDDDDGDQQEQEGEE